MTLYFLKSFVCAFSYMNTNIDKANSYKVNSSSVSVVEYRLGNVYINVKDYYFLIQLVFQEK